MIPTLIAIGLVLGAVPPTWPRRHAVVAVLALAAAVGWGLIVGSGVAQVGGAATLGFANLAVGVGLGAAIGWLGRQLAARPPASPSSVAR